MRTKGFESAAETTKQIITLSTGIIALTVTFAGEFKQPDTALSVPFSLKLSWLFFCLAIFSAVFTLMAITGSIDRLALDSSERHESDDLDSANAVPLTVNDPNIRRPALIMVFSFFGGLICTILAGWSISG